MTERMDTCASCRFFAPYSAPKEVTHGDCRRRAPSLADHSWTNPNCPELGRNAQYVREWPTTRAEDWCGEYELKSSHG